MTRLEASGICIILEDNIKNVVRPDLVMAVLRLIICSTNSHLLSLPQSARCCRGDGIPRQTWFRWGNHETRCRDSIDNWTNLGPVLFDISKIVGSATLSSAEHPVVPPAPKPGWFGTNQMGSCSWTIEHK